MKIRHALIDDVRELAGIEEASYPKEEGASEKSIRKRIEKFPDCFWIMDNNEKIVTFINGMLTDREDLCDEMYDKPDMHDVNGDWLMIFSVVTDGDERGNGYASRVMKQVIKDMKESGKKGIVLTCKETLISFYEQFGYINEGKSKSVHGNAVWYQMRLLF